MARRLLNAPSMAKKERSGGHLALWIVGLLLLLGGVAALGIGLWFFGSAAMTPSSQFFEDPHTTMDRTKQAAFLGVGLFGLGSLVAPAGAVVTLIAGVLELYRSPRVAA